MADRFVSDPHEVVRSGQVVRVKVVSVDVERQRIGLSLRLNDTPAQRRDDRKPVRAKNSGRRAPEAKGSMADALRKAGFGQ
jgi:uncharacterized protein